MAFNKTHVRKGKQRVTVIMVYTVRISASQRARVVDTAISIKVVGKSARDNPERYGRWLWGYCSSKKFERVVLEATDICLRVLKESNKSRFDSFSRYEQCIDHIPYYLSGLSRAHFFWQPFWKQLYTTKHEVIYLVHNLLRDVNITVASTQYESTNVKKSAE